MQKYNKKGGWFRPYILNPHNIEKVVQTGPGVYVLGNVGPDKKFKIKHMKSSGNVKRELQDHLGKYHVFMYKPLKFQLPNYQARQQAMFY
jgi:hypothetical protein